MAFRFAAGRPWPLRRSLSCQRKARQFALREIEPVPPARRGEIGDYTFVPCESQIGSGEFCGETRLRRIDEDPRSRWGGWGRLIPGFPTRRTSVAAPNRDISGFGGGRVLECVHTVGDEAH